MLGGLIAGAIGGAAKGAGELAEGKIDDERKANLAQQLADIDLEKQKRIEEFRQDLKITGMEREAQAAVKVSGITRQGQLDNDAQFAEPEAASAANKKKLNAQAEISGGAVQAEADRDFTKFSAGKNQRDAKFREDVNNLNDPAYLAGKRAEAKATHFESAGSAASAAATSWELAQKKQVADLRAQLSKLPKDSPERETLQQRIQDLSGGTTKGDTLAQQVAAARAVLNDMDSSDDEKEAARKFLGTVVTNATAARGGAGSSYPTPSQSHIDALRKNPNMSKEFDKKFGPGAAQKHMNDR